MKSVILITSSDKEVANIYEQWKDKTADIGFDDESLGMSICEGRIYVDHLGEGEACYEEGELAHVTIDKPIFYLICYSDSKIMKRFLQESVFPEGSFLDNDFGDIFLVDKVKEGEILDFIE